MAEVGAAAAVIGTIDVGMKGIRNAYSFLRDVKNAPKAVASTRDELAQLQVVLRSIPRDVETLGELNTAADKMNLEDIVESCDRDCAAFQTRLAQWIPDTSDATAWQRVIVGFRKRSFRDVQVRLQVREKQRQGLVIAAHSLVAQGEAQIAKVAREVEEQSALELQNDTAVESSGSVKPVDDATNARHQTFRQACEAALLLTRSAGLRQKIGDFDLGDDNDIQVGVPREYIEKVREQIHGGVKVGKNNKVRSGVF